MQKYLEIVVASLTESLVFTAICAVPALAGVLLLGLPFLDGFGFVLLVVGAGLMLVGGALSFVTPGKARVFNVLIAPIFGHERVKMTPEDFQRSENRAALYSLTGFLLFGYALLLAIVVV